MISKTYENYRDSELSWIDQLPTHWTSKRMNWLFRFVSGGTPSTSVAEYWEGDIPWVSSKDMKSLYLADTEDHITQLGLKESSTKVVPSHSCLLAIRSGILRHSLPVAVLTTDAAINQDIRGAIPLTTDVIPSYVAYLITGNQDALLSLWRQQGATVESLDFPRVNSSFIPFPPSGEQVQIANFLDRATGKIDLLVSKKRELLDLLEEKRRALITRCVTRGLPPDAAEAAGLNPNPNLKPSGIDWIGDFPEHWDIVPVGYLASLHGGSTPSRSNSEYWDGDVPWVSPKDMKRPRINDSIDRITDLALSETTIRLIEPGAVLVVIRGMILAHTFPVAINDSPVTINQDMKALRPGKRLDREFLYWKLNGLQSTFVALADESAHGTKKIETDTITKFPFAFPKCKSEQQAIADFLNERSSRYERLKESVTEAIATLLEYRSALITAAVTGKIDVREVEA